MKILVADDSKTTLTHICAALQKLEHEVVPASSGFEAIEIFKKNRPDLIILDVMMEGMDGFECAKRIRELNDEDWIPIIFLSASVDDASIAKGINAGGDDYLTKPFSEVTLAAKIKAMQRIAQMRTKLFDMTEELKVLSSTDTLTGLYNRFQFEKTIVEKIDEASRYNFKISLLFIDIDHFKSINDSLGHHIGDLLLQEVAHRLQNTLRISDFVARIGGDEFVVMLSHIKEDGDPTEIAEKLISVIAEPYHLEGNQVRISASIGIACYPKHGMNSALFVQNADIAMYHAKESGRNNFQFYSESLNERYQHQISLEQELKFALDRNQFYLTYQPIFNLLTKKVVGMEALLRWRHPEFGLISPNIFIPIAEETGLIIELGTWVLKKVCMEGARWAASGCNNFILSVNLSLHQFLQEGFFETVVSILEETKMPPNQLELEITETTVITYTVQLKRTINKLHNLGVGISIDDFGTRYSALTSLRYLPISTLKIDKTFLKDVINDPKNNIIVKSLIALGTSLNLNVIAEGVQTEEQMQFLVLNGCFKGQGFFLSKPLNETEMLKILIEHEDNPSRTIP